MRKIFLASKSPRRKEILSNAGFDIELVSVSAEETYPATLAHNKVAEYIAKKKARCVENLPSDGLLLTADTIVVLNDKILEKPISHQHAKEMLRTLSGKKHKVITGVCIMDGTKCRSFSDTSKVWFAELSDAEIDQYVASKEPMDKAGAYGIQKGLGMVAVKKIKGSYFNIMGLPIHRVYQEIISW